METVIERPGELRPRETRFGFAQHRNWACVSVFFLTVGLRLALLPWLPVPNPVIHDEFSNLLAGDTFVHGRLANPPHSLWPHFETFEELQQPVYASKYPPLQGVALAFGEKFFGQPWAGVLLSSALMCAAVCWMLQGWIAPEWALLGALLFAIRIGVLSYWTNSFEGGSLPALGAALAFGAVARIWRERKYAHAFTWALGIAVMMHSRPFDAVVIAVLSSVTLVVLLRNSGISLASAFTRLALPAAAVLGLSVAGVAYYDVRLTGHALTLPHALYERQYIIAPPFLFLPLKPQPVYRHAVIHDFFAGQQMDLWRDAHSNPPLQYVARLSVIEAFFFGSWLVMAPLLLWPFAIKTPEERVGAALSAAGALSILPLVMGLPHYAAGFAAMFYLRFLQSLSRLTAWRGWAGRMLAVATVAVFLVSGRDYFSAVLAHRSATFGEDRAALSRKLAALPGKQLVLVRYEPGHNSQDEWVFNAADIDASKVVWAREMGPQQDQELIDSYRDRHLWLVEADRNPPALSPYPLNDSQKELRR